MEKRNRSSRKRKHLGEYLNLQSNTHSIFPLLLAALCNSPNETDLILTCINNLQLSNSQLIPNISVMPILLRSKCAKIACRSVEILGAASLLCIEGNEQIALDTETVKALISALRHPKSTVSMAACNAVLDLSTTCVGRHQLLELSALNTLLSVFLQVPWSSKRLYLYNTEDTSGGFLRIALEEDEYTTLLLRAAITLINSCNIDQLGKIPRLLSETCLVTLQKLWAKVHQLILVGDVMKPCKERQLLLSNILTNSLAESTFRLSLNSGQSLASMPLTLVESRMFCWEDSSFVSFIVHHWETSPSLVRRLPGSLTEENDIFADFAQSINLGGSSPSFLTSMLQSFVSCPPIASDDLDLLSFLNEVRSELGCPIIYQQDLRVLKTENHSKNEMHFFHNDSDPCCSKSPFVFDAIDINKCEEAYKEGYTIAIRGMEFRFASIAAISDAMASLFGQPSIGANLYLTPPNSQGLALHYDDHCVFVCQIFGKKHWTIYPQQNMQLPRLYDPLHGSHGSEIESSPKRCTKFLLREGNILYIPRGFRHEACTDDNGSSEFAEFSLHLTFGIEVEPPFEWEGFVHVALHFWNQARVDPSLAMKEASSGILNVMSVNMLHLMIELIGASDPTFQKACLAAALSLPLDTNDWRYENQRAIFSHLIDKINEQTRFFEMLRRVEMAIERNEDPFYRISWLQHLNVDKEVEIQDWNAKLRNEFPSYAEDKKEIEAAFLQLKTKFCNEVLFEDVISCYKLLLEKYRKARKQYTNGMLSLHCS
ncbi:hypothetical protein K2173_012288 [Erythroxylum novogranatense]|uniref:Bifunctional lysine-specific demethylase and histidyl-hydroxylase n=1 Tax=Erythroxylum novogranatense TaxID=1862640 RepID=A0AAV8SBZ2_9ROSI|nr:hypothetical protein K2173_012288 [Erythroxylum novogranatense]